METTLTELIETALAKRTAGNDQNNGFWSSRPETRESETLANNALEEALSELIDARINKILNATRA